MIKLNKITECPICKSKNIVELTNETKAYGLVKVTPPANVILDNFIPVKVFCCKDCGHIELKHVDPKVITIDKQ